MLENYFGLRALVVDNVDPKKLNRVKIRVKGLMEGIPDDNLPWAKYISMMPTGKGGQMITPAIGSKVFVRFAEGEIQEPFYFGGVVEESSDLPDKKKDKRFILFQSPNKGITIAINEDTEDIEIQTKSYNTTLGAFIDLFLSHTHPTPAGPSGNVQAGVPPITALDFNKGSL